MMKVPTSPEEWKEMDKYFCHHSYADGFKLTDKDASLLKQFSKAINSEYVHIVRWYNHMKAVCPQAAVAVSNTCAPKQAKPTAVAAAPPAAAAKDDDDDDDDDIDLFGSDDEDAAAEAERIKQERLKAYHEKKSKKPAVIAKSSIILDVKPWDDETDMAEMEKNVRSIQMDGLLWGVSKLVPVGYGIKKLQISLVIEDDKVSVDLLTEEIEKFEDFVQSVDIAAFNKI